MKASILLTYFLLAIVSHSQNELTGTWLLPDKNSKTPVGIDFKENGEFVIIDVHQAPNRAYSTIQGYYHFEGNSLVTITWEGTEIVTSRFNYNLQNGNLILEQTYPNTLKHVFKREAEILITKSN